MAKITYYENFVDVYGRGWLRDTTINTRYTIKPSEIDTVLQAIAQGTVSEWVKKRAGDFSCVTDFHLEVLDHVVRQMDDVNDSKEIKEDFLKAAFEKIKQSFMEAVNAAGGDADHIWEDIDHMTARELMLLLAPNNVLFCYKKPGDTNDSYLNFKSVWNYYYHTGNHLAIIVQEDNLIDMVKKETKEFEYSKTYFGARLDNTTLSQLLEVAGCLDANL